jgi:hypothetical protein
VEAGDGGWGGEGVGEEDEGAWLWGGRGGLVSLFWGGGGGGREGKGRGALTVGR